MEKKIRLVTVDDSNLMQKILKRFVDQYEHIELVDHAFDAHEARKMIKLHNPDVLTLDVEMPGMNGLEFLERLMNVRPMPVIMFSSHTAEGAEITLKALELGAVDFLQKPRQGLEATMTYLNKTLLSKLETAKNIRPRSLRQTMVEMEKSNAMLETPISQRQFTKDAASKQIIAIGASTGGVSALRAVLETLPNNLPPIVITQHMPEGYTQRFAQRLDRDAALTVVEAQDGMELKAGHAYLAPGTHHLVVQKQIGAPYMIQLSDGELVSGHRPSVDVMFQSLCDSAPKGKVLAVMLTGMGKDGANAMLKLRENDHSTIGQDEASCVVYGMPKAAFELGAVQRQVPLDEVSHEIMNVLCGSATAKKRQIV